MGGLSPARPAVGCALLLLAHLRSFAESSLGPGAAQVAGLGAMRWVAALEYETQAEACTRVGLRSTRKVLALAWNETTLRIVAEALGAVSVGQAGCCSAGMWCNDTGARGGGGGGASAECFTHSNSSASFANHGWFGAGAGAARPVYSCVAPSLAPGSSSAPVQPPLITSIATTPRAAQGRLAPGSRVTLAGNNFGAHKDGLSITFGAPGERQACADPQFCHHVCRTCNSGSARCRNDEVCIQDGVLGGRCVPFCKPDSCGQDSLCPCDTRCYEVLFSGRRSASFICSPRHPLTSGSICGGFEPTEDKLVCTVPTRQWAAPPPLALAEEAASRRRRGLPKSPARSRLGISFERATDGAAAVDVLSRATLSTYRMDGACAADSDCDDGNPCTIDRCVRSAAAAAAAEPETLDTAVCAHVAHADCQTLPQPTLRRHGHAQYRRAQGHETLPTAASVGSVGGSSSGGGGGGAALVRLARTSAFRTSSASLHDDKPLATTELGFAFPFFQQRHTRAFLSPNGMLQLDAAQRCAGVPFNAGCPLVESHNSVIAPFFADFDPSSSTGSVRYRKSSGRFDVVWLEVSLYALPSVNYTFGASLFEDGSLSVFWEHVPGREAGESAAQEVYRSLPPFYERTPWLAGVLAPPKQRADDVMLQAQAVAPGRSFALCRAEPVASLSTSGGPVDGGTNVTVFWDDPPCMAESALHVNATYVFVCTFGGVAVPAVKLEAAAAAAAAAASGGRTGYRCVAPPAPGGRVGAVRVDLARIYVPPCPSLHFSSKAPTTTSDRQCQSVRKCGPGTYESVAPEASSNRECKACDDGMFKGYTGNQPCAPWRKCPPDSGKSKDGSATADRECTPCEQGVTFSLTDSGDACENIGSPSANATNATNATVIATNATITNATNATITNVTNATIIAINATNATNATTVNVTYANGALVAMELYAMDGQGVLGVLGNSSAAGSVQSRPLMYEYRAAAAAPPATAGCDALAGGVATALDQCGVCGGTNTSIDCFGSCFGSAELCGAQCTGGHHYTSTSGSCKQLASTGCVPPIRTTSMGSSGGSSSGYQSPYNRNAYNTGDGQQSLVLIAVLACTMVLLSVCMWIVRVSLVHRLRNSAAGAALFGAAELPGLTDEQIEAGTELLKPAEVAKLADDITCSICICEFEEGEDVRRLPCHHLHIYHTECVDQWFQQSRLCPMCKQDVLMLSGAAGSAVAEGGGAPAAGGGVTAEAVAEAGPAAIAGGVGGAGVLMATATLDDDGIEELDLNRGGGGGGGGLGGGTRRASGGAGRVVPAELASIRGVARPAFESPPDSQPRTIVVQVAPLEQEQMQVTRATNFIAEI